MTFETFVTVSDFFMHCRSHLFGCRIFGTNFMTTAAGSSLAIVMAFGKFFVTAGHLTSLNCIA